MSRLVNASRALGVLAAAVVLAVVAVGCGDDDDGSSGAAAESSGEVQTFTAGYTPFISSAPLLAPQATEIFEGQGLKANLKPIPVGPAGIPALLNGELDFVLSDPIGVITAITQGVPIGIVTSGSVAPSDFTKDYTAIMGAPDIKSLSDLEGKTVAVPGLKTASHLYNMAVLDKNGVDSSTVKYVELPATAVIESLKKGTIQAAAVGEPFQAAALGAGMNRLESATSAALVDVPNVVWVTTKKFAAESPEVVDAFAASVQELYAAVGNDEEVLRKAALELGAVPPELVDKIVLPTFIGDDEKALASLPAAEDLMIEYDFLKEEDRLETQDMLLTTE